MWYHLKKLYFKNNYKKIHIKYTYKVHRMEIKLIGKNTYVDYRITKIMESSKCMEKVYIGCQTTDKEKRLRYQTLLTNCY